MKRTAMRALLLALALLAIPAAGQEDPPPPGHYLAAGGPQALWIVRVDPDGRYDAAVRLAGAPWRWVVRDATGTPVQAAVLGQTLHLVLEPQGYLLLSHTEPFTRHGRNWQDPRWPPGQPPLALAPMAELNGFDRPAIVAIVDGPGRPATDGGDADDPDPAPRMRDALLVFASDGLQWRHVVTREDVRPAEARRVFAAAADGVLYLLLDDAPGGRMMSWDSQQWQDLPLPDVLERGRILGMVSLGSRLGVVVRQADAAPPADEDSPPAPAGLVLVVLDPVAETVRSMPLETPDELPAPAPDAPVQVGRIADQIALVWASDQGPAMATYDLAGQLMEAELVAEPRPRSATAERVWSYYLWGVMLSLLVPMFIFRGPRPVRPFAPPVNSRPGSLPQRLLAALIDFVPFLFVAGIVVPAVWPQEDEVVAVAYGQPVTEAMVYGLIAALTLFTIYCIAMEWRFGWTLGKRIFRLHVVTSDATRPDLRAAFMRNVVKIIEIAVPPLQLMLLLPLLSRTRQRVGDMIAQTGVVQWTGPRPDPAHARPQQNAKTQETASRNDP